ncbi:cell wall anchor protein [Ralstonia pseudosolanacearum]|uniref:cell wall anchor protein n=1 Tax=Ralstonia pseudosolanacearum TaxID=1310165 RepID=UPI001FF92F85
MKNFNVGGSKFILSAMMAAVLTACGGGDGGSTADTGTSTAPAASPQSLTGTVAVGTALANAKVIVIDAKGNTTSTTSDASGSYTVSLSGLTAPLLIAANDPAGISLPLYSVVASTATGSSAPAVANVTPLTTAVTAQLTADGNPGGLATSSALAGVSSSAVAASVAKLNTALSAILAAKGLDAGSFDPIGGAFTPNQTGADAVIDAVAITQSTTGSGLQLSSVADPNTAIQLSQTAASTAPLAVPPQPANYLATLVSQLGQCLAGTASACSTAIDASYLNQGFATFQARHPGIAATGSKLTGVKTVTFLKPNTLPNITGNAALVYFLFTDATGTANFASDIVQQRSNGTWDIIGNQEQFNLYIASFLGRKQFLNAADAGNGRLESGLDIRIPATLTVGSTTTTVTSASVQGPGLPAGGVYLTNIDPQFNPRLTFPTPALTGPFIANGPVPRPDIGMSTQYKWSWASLSGGSSTYAPNGLAEYSSQPVDVSSITQYGVYTVTLYDATGTAIGTPQKVLNVGPNAAAAAAINAPWQTLNSTTIGNYLTAGTTGPGCQGNPATVTWTNLANAPAYPNLWEAFASSFPRSVVNGVPSALQSSLAINSSTPTSNSDGSLSSVVANAHGGLTATASCGAVNAQQVQLGWQAGGLYYSNSWQFNN